MSSATFCRVYDIVGPHDEMPLLVLSRIEADDIPLWVPAEKFVIGRQVRVTVTPDPCVLAYEVKVEGVYGVAVFNVDSQYFPMPQSLEEFTLVVEPCWF